ncbi:MAG: SDR family NAD(P)-dependent oxidoreductase [Pirellulales bacterium]|nr:SDR family NAD(P)-dependent oxidoreductase [Pirellulales bacterium]
MRLASDGWNLLLADIDAEHNNETIRLVAEAGGTAEAVELDVADHEAWVRLEQQLRDRWPQLDLLVNNAGVAAQGEVGEFPLDDWHWVLSTNLHGTIYGCHTFVPWLKQNPSGAHIINTASFAAFVSAPSMGAYGVAKAGVVSLSETLYGELRQHNVGVTVVCPSFFETRLLDRGKFREDSVKQMAADLSKYTRLTAETVADAAIRGMQRKKLYVVLRRRARWYWRAKRMLPAWFHKTLAKGFYKEKAKAETEEMSDE